MKTKTENLFTTKWKAYLKNSKLLAVPVLLLGFAVMTPTNAANLLQNSGFESGSNGWQTSGTAAAQLIESSGRSGNRLAHWSSSNSYSVDTYQTVTNLQPCTYRLSAEENN